MKKLLSRIALVALSVAIVALAFVPTQAFAATNPKITLSGSYAGGKVKITATIRGNTGISTANFRLDYDRSVLKLDGYERGNALTSLALTTTGNQVATTEYRFLFDSNDGVCDKSDGVMLVITFSVIGDGDCRVNLSYRKNADVIALRGGKQVFVNPIVESAAVRPSADGGSTTVVTIPSDDEPLDGNTATIIVAVAVIAACLIALLVIIFKKRQTGEK